MTVWRVSNHVTLDGGGGLRASHRWHTRGRRIVYCAPNPATSLLEILVHNEVDVQDLPRTYQFLEIDLPDSVSFETLDLNSLPRNWRSNGEITRKRGERLVGVNVASIRRIRVDSAVTKNSKVSDPPTGMT